MPKDIVNNKKEKKEKKHFFKDFKAELKKVIWPTPKQLVNNTVAVIVIVLITAAIVFVLDIVFELMNSQGIDKLRSFVDSRAEQTENTTNNVETENAVNEILNTETTNSTENTTNTEETNTAENSETEE